MSGRAGQRVLVTGASSGIGRAVALELGRRHARLILVARREDRLRCVAKEITMLGAPNPIVTVADLAERGAAARVGRDALDWLGGLDVLINNAGGGVGGTQVMVADRDEGREAFEVNLWSPVALAAEVLPFMRAQRAGTIVNVTSLAQVMTWPMMGHYAASKASLAKATETLRLEALGTGVKVVEVVLGPVQTAMQGETGLVPGIERALKSSPTGRPDQAARRIIKAMDRGRPRVVYPRPLLLAYALPTITRSYVAALVRQARGEIDPDDQRVVRTGSFGGPEARAARQAWEQAHLASAPSASGATTDPR